MVLTDDPRSDQVLMLRNAATESLRRREGSRWDSLCTILPGDGLERTTAEQRSLVASAIGRDITPPASMGHANVAYLRAQLRRWAAQRKASA